MGTEHKIGAFEISVRDPYPAWVELRYAGKEFLFHHKELADLEYAVRWAKREAALKLRGDGRRVSDENEMVC